MHTNVPYHEPSLLMMTCGDTQPVRPSMGSWLLYGLGSENQDLPGFVVHVPRSPRRRRPGQLVDSNSFLPGIFQGTRTSTTRNINPQGAGACRTSTTATCGRAAQREQLDLLQPR